MLKVPSSTTLRKYGLTLQDWKVLAKKQGYVCAICGKLPASNMLTIDHEHVRGWAKMPPSRRKLFVRCLACSYCNRVVIRKGVTIEKMQRAIKMLTEYEKRRGKVVTEY